MCVCVAVVVFLRAEGGGLLAYRRGGGYLISARRTVLYFLNSHKRDSKARGGPSSPIPFDRARFKVGSSQRQRHQSSNSCSLVKISLLGKAVSRKSGCSRKENPLAHVAISHTAFVPLHHPPPPPLSAR